MTVKPGNPRYKFLKSAKNCYLSDNENETVFGLLDEKTFSLATAICRVYTSTDNKWCLKDEGVLCFVKSHSRRTFLLQLFNMDLEIKTWELEMYIEINPQCSSKFIVIEGENCMIGLSFAYQSDSDAIMRMIEQKIMARGSEKEPKNSKSRNKMLSGNQMKLDLKKLKIPGKMRISGNKSKGGISKADIGLPSGFRNLADKKPDVDAEFFRNNPEYEEFFKQAFPDMTLSDIKSDKFQMKKLIDFMKIHKTQISNYNNRMKNKNLHVRKNHVLVQKIESEDDFPSEDDSPYKVENSVKKIPPIPPTKTTNTSSGIPPPPPPPPLPPSAATLSNLVNQQLHGEKNVADHLSVSPHITKELNQPKLNNDLMNEIHNGTILRKVQPSVQKTNDRDSLLSAIRQAPKLRPAVDRKSEPKIEQEDDLVMQLRAAMAMHRTQVQDDDSDEFSDDDWSD